MALHSIFYPFYLCVVLAFMTIADFLFWKLSSAHKNTTLLVQPAVSCAADVGWLLLTSGYNNTFEVASSLRKQTLVERERELLTITSLDRKMLLYACMCSMHARLFVCVCVKSMSRRFALITQAARVIRNVLPLTNAFKFCRLLALGRCYV